MQFNQIMQLLSFLPGNSVRCFLHIFRPSCSVRPLLISHQRKIQASSSNIQLFIPVPLVRAISISGLSLLEVSSTVVIIDSILVSIGWRLNKIRGNIGRDSNKGPAGAAVANQGCQQPSSVTLRYYQASSAS